jgi:hypothetical protein
MIKNWSKFNETSNIDELVPFGVEGTFVKNKFTLIGYPSLSEKSKIIVSYEEFDFLYDKFYLHDYEELNFGEWGYKDEDKQEIMNLLEMLRDSKNYNL